MWARGLAKNLMDFGCKSLNVLRNRGVGRRCKDPSVVQRARKVPPTLSGKIYKAYASVCNLDESGTNEDDRNEKAQIMYQSSSKVNRLFAMLD